MPKRKKSKKSIAILDVSDYPKDGRWYQLGYIESTSNKCDLCGFCARYSRGNPGDKKARYLCSKHFATEVAS